MKHIKKFFELFDTEDLKAENEIDYISGNFKDLGKNIDSNFKNETIVKFLSKLSNYHFPFFDVFLDPIPRFPGFEIYTSFDEGYHILGIESEDYRVVFGVKIDQVNKYDVFVYLHNEDFPDDEEKSPGYEYDSLTIDKLVEVISNEYIPYLMEAGFDSIINYNIDNLTVNN